jgi:hypothetical protein
MKTAEFFGTSNKWPVTLGEESSGFSLRAIKGRDRNHRIQLPSMCLCANTTRAEVSDPVSCRAGWASVRSRRMYFVNATPTVAGYTVSYALYLGRRAAKVLFVEHTRPAETTETAARPARGDS